MSAINRLHDGTEWLTPLQLNELEQQLLRQPKRTLLEANQAVHELLMKTQADVNGPALDQGAGLSMGQLHGRRGAAVQRWICSERSTHRHRAPDFATHSINASSAARPLAACSWLTIATTAQVSPRVSRT